MTADLLVVSSGLLQWPGGIKTKPGYSSSSIVGNKIHRMTADRLPYPLLQGAPHWLTSVYPLTQIHQCPLHVHTFLPPSFSSVPTTYCYLLNHGLPPDLQVAGTPWTYNRNCHGNRTFGFQMNSHIISLHPQNDQLNKMEENEDSH